MLLTRFLYCGAGPGNDLWKHGGAIPHLHATRRADYWRNWVLFFKVKGQIGLEYLSKHWQHLSLSLRRSKNVFGCYPSSLKVPNCVLKQQTQSAIVWRCHFFWLSSSTWSHFFRCCLIHLHVTDFSLFRKGYVLHFTEKQKRLSFPNHHWTEWTKLHVFDDNTANFVWN